MTLAERLDFADERGHGGDDRLDVTYRQGWIRPPYNFAADSAKFPGMATPEYIARMRDALRRIMKAKGAKPTTLSQAVGPSKTLVSEVLNKNNDIKLSTVARLAQELDVSIGEVLGIQQLKPAPDEPAVNAATLEPILAQCLRVSPPDGWSELDAPLLARSVEYGLRFLATGDATQANVDDLAGAGRAASLRLRELRRGA